MVDRFAGIEPPSDAQGMEASVFGLVTFRDGAVDTTELPRVRAPARQLDRLARLTPSVRALRSG